MYVRHLYRFTYPRKIHEIRVFHTFCACTNDISMEFFVSLLRRYFRLSQQAKCACLLRLEEEMQVKKNQENKFVNQEAASLKGEKNPFRQ